MKTKTIYSLRLMQYLIDNGCELLEIKQHPHIKHYKCYVFVETEKLKDLMREYSKKKNEGE
jgi:hypothetical protein